MARQLTGALTFPAGVAVGVGVGGAVSGAIEPRLRALQNEAWQRFTAMPLQAVEAAQLVADGERDMRWGVAEAANSGVSEERFRALVDMIDTAIDVSLLMDAFRRGLITEATFRRGAKRHGIEDEWLDVLVQLRQRPLSPAEAANAWQQGFLGEQEAEQEAALSGVDGERARIQRELAGLPPGAMDSLDLLRRGIIDEQTYRQIVREGHTKTKYTDALLALRQKILPAREWAGLWLRGWVTEQEAKAGGALDGYDERAMELLYKNRGRPATTRQVHIGYARGGKLPGARDERDAFERAVRQSNVRTEYTDLLWASRYTYPSAFVIRGLAQAGTFDRETTLQILTEIGWPPKYAQLAADDWTQAKSAGPGTKWADRARTRVFAAAWGEYLDGKADEAKTREALTAIGASDGEQDTIIRLLDLAKTIRRLELTPSQIKKAYKKGPPDGYSYDQAIAELIDRGMTMDDADTFLTT